MKSLVLKSRFMIENKEGKIVFGEGRKEIFENIEKTGSMYQTARNVGMSYKAVWSKIKASEDAAGVILVEKIGKTVGSRLTKEGKALLDAYNRLQKRSISYHEKSFKYIFKSVIPERSKLNTSGNASLSKTFFLK